MPEFNPLEDKAQKAPHPFGLKERLVTTLIFDTQPKRKKEWLNKLGYDVNPKDDNEIKPIGATDDQYFPIDPGGVFDFSQYGKKGGVSELGKDALEASLDFLQGSATEATGEGAGIIGAVGGPAGFVAGRSAGRMAMFNAIENMKDSIGNFFLEEDMPIDTALRATQTAIQAVGPEALATGGKALKKAAEKTFSNISSGVRNLLSIGNGKIGEQAWAALKKNPSMIADESALKNASSDIASTVDRLTGAGPDGNSINRSVLGDKLSELEPQRKVQADILSQDPNNGAPLDKIIRFFEEKKLELADPNKFPLLSEQRKDSIRYINGKINELKKLVKVPEAGSVATGTENRLTFGQLDSVVKELQSDLYSPKLMTKDWRNAVKSLVDGSPESPGLNNLLKEKATAAGSPYAQIKEQQSKIFKAYDNVIDNVTPEKAKRFVLGDETIDPRFTSTDDVARRFGDAVKSVDEVLGTKTYDAIKDGQIRGQFWQAIADKGSSGSGKVLTPSLAVGGLTAGVTQKMTNDPALATIAGSLATGATGALMQPKIGTRVAIGAENMANKIANAGPTEALGGMAAQLGTQEINRDLPSQEPEQQDFNPMSDFNPLEDMNQ